MRMPLQRLTVVHTLDGVIDPKVGEHIVHRASVARFRDLALRDRRDFETDNRPFFTISDIKLLAVASVYCRHDADRHERRRRAVRIH